MFKFTLSAAALLGSAVFAFPADYTATPLHPRPAAVVGAKAFTRLSAADTGVTVPNSFNDPRMWGQRFRELAQPGCIHARSD